MTRPGSAHRSLELPRPGRPPHPRAPEPVRWTLASGLRVAAVSRHGIPQVALRLTVPAGAASDPAAFPGAATLVGALLTEGTERFGADELNARLDALGASVSVQVGHDFAEVDLVLLSETLEEGLVLFAELVTRPAFPRREVERTRAETLDALAARVDEPANVADDRVAEEVFGPGHPYGRITAGTPEGVSTVGLDDLRAFHAARYRPHGSILAAAGDLDAAELDRVLARVFADWSGEAVPADYPATRPPPGRAGERVDVPWPEATQGEIRVAGVGLARDSPDWVAAAVANFLLGGSTITGRLGANLREEKGWTYGVRSGFTAALRPGGWVIETAVDVEVVDAAFREIRRELDRFVREEVSAEELARAKDALILSLPRAFETPGRIVGRIGAVEAYRLPADYWAQFPERVAAVTSAEVLRVARAYFDPDALVQVVVG
jgi:zinc protease